MGEARSAGRKGEIFISLFIIISSPARNTTTPSPAQLAVHARHTPLHTVPKDIRTAGVGRTPHAHAHAWEAWWHGPMATRREGCRCRPHACHTSGDRRTSEEVGRDIQYQKIFIRDIDTVYSYIQCSYFVCISYSSSSVEHSLSS